MDEKKPSWLGPMVTKRATVMTPLLILNTVLLFFATAIFLLNGAWFLFIVWGLVAIYTVVRHEQWAKNAPWLLAPQKVAIQGMKLFGTSEKPIKEATVIDLDPVDNPQLGKIESSSERGIQKR